MDFEKYHSDNMGNKVSHVAVILDFLDNIADNISTKKVFNLYTFVVEPTEGVAMCRNNIRNIK